MNVLLLSPIFPSTFWSFERVLQLIERKVLLPPLGLITVAALLPQEWNFRLVDRNVRSESEQDWEWADLIVVSAMMVQKEDFQHLIREGVRRGKRVAVGGPYPTSIPADAHEAGAQFLVLDEGELTIPKFVEAIERGDEHGVFRSAEKPDVTGTPIPRFDLLEMGAYDSMSVQFSRGCPFQCEFCDIIVLYGRKSRTKTPAQMLGELQALYDLGWDRSVFVVDDNFIGNQRNVKLMLRELAPWMHERGFPFRFITEASINLAEDEELLELMVEAGFDSVFLGIETPDEDSLTLTRKFQNNRNPLTESCRKITRAGLRVLAGFIIGFDGEKTGAGRRISEFVEQTAIPDAMFSMLQALPGTALWERLEREGRLVGEGTGMNQSTLMNFVPTRPVEEIAEEYVQAFWELYEPSVFLQRCYRHAMELGMPKGERPFKMPAAAELRGLLKIIWLQGVQRPETRKLFWTQLWKLLSQNPQALGPYLTVCAHGEHFFEFRQEISSKIKAQLERPLAHNAARS